MTRTSAKPVRRIRVSLPPERPEAALMRGARVPGAAVVTLLLLVFGVLVLAPGVSQYLDQRQHTADLRATVAQQQRDLSDLRAQRARWGDPAYLRAQAGSRLFYVLPGQTVYRVAGLPATPTAEAPPPAATAQQVTTDWTETLYGSLVTAGTTDAATSRLRSALPER